MRTHRPRRIRPTTGKRRVVFYRTQGTAPNTVQFQCSLQCIRCIARTKHAGRCKRRSCRFVPYCWQHLRSQKGLQVKKSGIPTAGWGLFATRPFKKNELIIRYRGEKVTPTELEHRYDYDGYNVTAPYAIDGVDAACRRGAAAYINSTHGTNINANVRITPSLNVRANRAIRKGDELFTNYGRDYWEGANYLRTKNIS